MKIITLYVIKTKIRTYTFPHQENGEEREFQRSFSSSGINNKGVCVPLT